MKDNIDIAKWIGWDDSILVPSFHKWISPGFVPTDIECLELFVILIKRNLHFHMYYEGFYTFVIVHKDGTCNIGQGNTISLSILTSIFDLIDQQVK